MPGAIHNGSQDAPMSASFQQLANFIWSVADLLRGPYRPPQYERCDAATHRAAPFRRRAGTEQRKQS